MRNIIDYISFASVRQHVLPSLLPISLYRGENDNEVFYFKCIVHYLTVAALFVCIGSG